MDGVIDRDIIDNDIQTSIIFDYNLTTNSIIFNNSIQNNNSTTFENDILINDILTVTGGNDINNFVPVALPNDPNNLNIPIINSLGTIQTTDMLASNNGEYAFYACYGSTYLYNNVYLNGQFHITQLSQINLLQESLNNKLDVTASDVTTTSLLSLINNKPNLTDVNTTFNSKSNLVDAYTSITVNSLLNDKLDVLASDVTTSSLLSLINSKPNITDVNTTLTSNFNLINTKATTSDINTLLDLKAPINNPTFTGTISGITKSHVGLANVDNTTDANKPISTATQTALNLKAPLLNPTFSGTVAGITKAHVGLANVDDTTDANKPISTATQTALNLKAPINNPTFTGTISGITKAHVGLGNVDNTADTTKPISTAMQTALDLKAPINNPTFTGICTYSRCSARVFGAATVAATFGIIDITTANVNQTSTGIYVITMPTAHPSGTNYAVIGSICPASGAAGFFTGIVNSSTQFTCYIYNSAGSLNSYHFKFMTIP